MKERWKPIPGYEGKFMASDQGRIGRFPDMSISKLFKNKGYYKVTVPHPGSKKGYRAASVHQLVALAFIGKRPADCDTHHKNGNKQDNRAANLEYLPRGRHTELHKKQRK